MIGGSQRTVRINAENAARNIKAPETVIGREESTSMSFGSVFCGESGYTSKPTSMITNQVGQYGGETQREMEPDVRVSWTLG